MNSLFKKIILGVSHAALNNAFLGEPLK